uniref:Rad60/SUMO-like domain-containing protein n=1 Tax=Panthera tigris altaica TaxID=74533 RepID=A0A8C9J3R1_PANTA
MANEKPKQEVTTKNNDHINLKVAGQDGSVVYFKIKRHTLLSKLMKAYCERQVCQRFKISFQEYTCCSVYLKLLAPTHS